ncbi:MAG TPA: thioredoxin [Chromatiaceae bacterium]|nr:thioredoxin [Chromatiaceae bacterium]
MSNSPYIIEVTEDNYQQAVVDQSFQKPVLVDFWASWCQPCQMLMPILANLAEAYGGKFILAKINTEEQQGLAAQFGIRSIPTVKLFRNGQAVDEFAGALPESEIRAFLDQHIPRESDAQVEQARELLRQGNSDAALELLERAKASDPGNSRVDIVLAQAHAASGNTERALEILNALPQDAQDDPEASALKGMLHFEALLSSAPPEGELEQRLANDENDSQSRHLLAAYKVVKQDYEGALELLLGLMRKDRNNGDDAARKEMLRIFSLLGEDPLVARYRNRMMNLLY